MNRNFLPRQGVQLVDQSGCTTNPFYVWMQRLDSLLRGGAEIENITQTLAQLRATLADLQSTGYLPGTANVVGINSVVSLGDLVNGVVTVQLLGDVQTPYSFQFYAADNRCIRGWQWLHPVIEAGDCMVKTMDGFNVLGVARNEDDLPDTPSDGDAYLLESTGHILRWDDGGAEWVDEGEASGVTTLALEQLPDTGVGALLAITRDAFGRVEGTKEATITGTAGQIEVANGDAVAGLPTISLADVTPTAGGILQKYGFDAKGRRNEEEAATTDDLTEGATNLYFTDARAQEAVADILDGTGDVEIHYEDTPDPRIYAELSAGVQASLALADTALQPGDNISALTNDAGYLTDAPIDGNTYGRKDGAWEQITTSGSGTVTSVGLSVPTGFQVSGSPVTTSGTLTVTYDTGYQGYTSAEASKLSGIEAGATVGADWSVNLSNIPANITAWAGVSPADKVNVSGDTMSGNLTISTAGSNVIELSAPSGAARIIRYSTSGSNRWTVYTNGTAESGGNAGSNFVVRRYDDSGAMLSPDPFTISRASGVVAFGLRPTFAGNTPWDSGNFDASFAGFITNNSNRITDFSTLTSTALSSVFSATSAATGNPLGANMTGLHMRYTAGVSLDIAVTTSANPRLYVGSLTAGNWNEAWTTGNLADSGWTSISVGSGWSATNLARRRFGTRVKLRGSIVNTSGTRAPGTIVLTLPAGYRPSTPTMFLVPTVDSGVGEYRRVAVGDNGDIALPDGLPGGVTFWLDGIDFYTD